MEITWRDNKRARRQKHKRALKRRHAILFRVYYPTIDELVSREEHEKDVSSGCRRKWIEYRNGGYNYWNSFSRSGAKAYAKRCTNRKIRSMYNGVITVYDPEEVQALHGSQYEKEFDFWYAVD